jgi:hypothetical protein
MSADAVGLIPVDLRKADRAVLKPNSRHALPFPPAASSVRAAKPRKFADTRPLRDYLDLAERLEELEVHASI